MPKITENADGQTVVHFADGELDEKAKKHAGYCSRSSYRSLVNIAQYMIEFSCPYSHAVIIQQQEEKLCDIQL